MNEEDVKIYHFAREKWKVNEEDKRKARQENIIQIFKELKNSKVRNAKKSLLKEKMIFEMTGELIQRSERCYGVNLQNLQRASDSEIKDLYHIIKNFGKIMSQYEKNEHEVLK